MSNKVSKNNLAPKLVRSWLEIELRPQDPKVVTSNKVRAFQKQLAKICGMHIFCGPMIIAPDSKNSLGSYYSNKKFRPKDWNSYTWWTRPEATNVLSILNHSHESFYYYPDHNLIDISIATCKEYELSKVLKFVFNFWGPDKFGIRYAFLSPKISGYSWKSYPNSPEGRENRAEKNSAEVRRVGTFGKLSVKAPRWPVRRS